MFFQYNCSLIGASVTHFQLSDYPIHFLIFTFCLSQCYMFTLLKLLIIFFREDVVHFVLQFLCPFQNYFYISLLVSIYYPFHFFLILILKISKYFLLYNLHPLYELFPVNKSQEDLKEFPLWLKYFFSHILIFTKNQIFSWHKNIIEWFECLHSWTKYLNKFTKLIKILFSIECFLQQIFRNFLVQLSKCAFLVTVWTFAFSSKRYRDFLEIS